MNPEPLTNDECELLLLAAATFLIELQLSDSRLRKKFDSFGMDEETLDRMIRDVRDVHERLEEIQVGAIL